MAALQPGFGSLRAPQSPPSAMRGTGTPPVLLQLGTVSAHSDHPLVLVLLRTLHVHLGSRNGKERGTHSLGVSAPHPGPPHLVDLPIVRGLIVVVHLVHVLHVLIVLRVLLAVLIILIILLLLLVVVLWGRPSPIPSSRSPHSQPQGPIPGVPMPGPTSDAGFPMGTKVLSF